MTASDRFELFAFWRTSATYRVRVAFNLKGVSPQEHNVNLDVGEQRGEAFLKINPMGAIPALVDHEPGQSHTPLTQSLAILEFLDESFPTPALLPAEAHGRARVRSLAAMLAADTHPLITPQVKKYLTTHHRRLRRRGLARLADPLVHDRPAGAGTAPGQRGRDRHLLPRRHADDRRHLPGQHRRGDARLQDRGARHPDRASRDGGVRAARCVRQGGPEPPGGRPAGLTDLLSTFPPTCPPRSRIPPCPCSKSVFSRCRPTDEDTSIGCSLGGHVERTACADFLVACKNGLQVPLEPVPRNLSTARPGATHDLLLRRGRTVEAAVEEVFCDLAGRDVQGDDHSRRAEIFQG